MLIQRIFVKHQKIGLLLLIFGLLCFFNQRLADFLHFNTYLVGILACISASFVWVMYGIAQKLMSNRLTAQQVLLPIYLGCSMIFMPLAKVSQVFNLTFLQTLCLIYCCFNRLIAYGAYIGALNHWDIAKVSMIVTQIPILTLIFSEVLVLLAPQHIMIEKLNGLSYFGAGLVVCGALCSAIGYKFFSDIQKASLK